ncbi:MAG: acyl--CoA ligase [Deltaproteobacteria bacterium]|nr:acyl--CoA ligase [Deltaproteobacteria bacterium]
MTLVEMLERNARDLPDQTALIFRDEKVSYRQLNDRVNRLAQALLKLGCRPGDRVCFLLPRIPELVLTFLAGAKVRAIVAPVNFDLPAREIAATLGQLNPRVIVCHADYLTLLLPAGPETTFILTGSTESRPGCLLWDELLAPQPSHNPSLAIAAADPVYLNYTSGSTGNARGAVTTHEHIYWNTRSSVETLGLTPADVHLCLFAPFAHPHELFARPLYLGGTMVLLDSIRPRTIARTIMAHGVTCLMALAPFFRNLIEVAASEKFDLSSLRLPESGGMHTPVELIQAFREAFGVPIYAVWGSTETTGIALANHPGGEPVLGSVGQPCSYYEVKIVGEDGQELSPGMIGELIFRGPGVVQAYFEEQEENHYKYFRHGWYHSGDLGRRDAAGNFYFVERKSGMLKVAGHQVYPLEIELKLMRHAAIQEAAVIGIPDPRRGEVPKAFVVLKNGAHLERRDIIRYCAQEMATYKVPREVEICASLPKIGSGKINKKALRQ